MLRAVELCMRSRTSCYAAICYALKQSRALELRPKNFKVNRIEATLPCTQRTIKMASERTTHAQKKERNGDVGLRGGWPGRGSCSRRRRRAGGALHRLLDESQREGPERAERERGVED